GVFRVEAEAAERLRKSSIASGSVAASGIGKSGRGAIEVGGELRRIVEIEGRILRELDQMFGGGSERAAKNRFMDKIDAEAKGMAAGGAENIIAELIFLL